MNVVICAIAKNENKYLYEWAEYHIGIGFSHIYLYDNNDIDGERITLSLFKHLSDKVTIFNVRGESHIQKIVYQRCYQENDFDWCAFIDIDEFITFSEQSSITCIEDFLKDKSKYEGVHLNWMCFGDNGSVYAENRDVISRFKRPKRPFTFYYTYLNHSENEHVKSIIKKGLCINWSWSDNDFTSDPHTPWGLNDVCDAQGHRIPKNTPFNSIDYSVAYIRHYTTKSIQEYAIKVSRQCADCDNISFYNFPKFFRINKPTFLKLRWLKKNYPTVNILTCYHEYIKYTIVNYNLPFRFIFRSLRNSNKNKGQ